MEMRKQGGGEGQGTARSASKGRKQPGEQTPGSTNQDTSTNQGATQGEGSSVSPNNAVGQGTSIDPGAAPKPGMSTGQQQTGQGEQDLLQHAKQATGQIVNKVQEQAGTQLNRQKETAASELSQVANAVRRIRENLPQQDLGPIARAVGDYGEKAANNLDRLSSYIREQDPKQLLNDVQNFGRRQPALLLGGAFLLGFAGARLIRSSMGTGGSQEHQYGQTNVPRATFTPPTPPATRQSTNPGTV